MNRKTFLIALLACFLVVVVPASLYGQTPDASPTDDGRVFGDLDAAPPTDQIIIQFTDAAAESALLADKSSGPLPELSAAAGADVTYFRAMSGDAHVLKLAEALSAKEVAQVAVNLTAVPGVVYAEPDLIKTTGLGAQRLPLAPNLVPNDPQYTNQWHYRYVAGTSEGLNLEPAWSISTGSSSTVVAVIDTGILPHTDLAGKTVAGYDFIADVNVANDGDGRDSNPADPGDWVAANECYAGSDASSSSWHGTHVAGTIGAASNNSVGVAGVNWNAKILPIRVLGKCGGYTSDIVDGMRWAAGLSVTGVPANPNPAKVLNLSLGGSGACDITEQTAINAIVAAGTTVVIAAGNNNANASNYSPGNCNNIITVAATNRSGGRAYYSNYGNIVEVSAPGGAQSFANDPNGVLSTLDSGTTTPNNSNTYEYYQGTSMATPHVAGLASLILGMRPSYTPAQVLSLLQSTARAFPGGSTCNTSICGSGIVDAYQALNALNVVYDNFVYLPLVAKPLQSPVLQSISNADNDGNYSVSWTSVSGATSYTLQEDDNTSFTSPTTVYAGAGVSQAFTGKGVGTYYYRVNAVYSGQSSGWSNIQSVAVLPTASCTPQSGESNNIADALTTCSGHTATGQVSAADRDDVYKIQMVAGQGLTIVMTGSGGDADLYLFPPGTSDVNTDPAADGSTSDGNNELIQGTVNVGGTWYIDVYSYSGTTSYAVTATVTNALTGETTTWLLSPEDARPALRQNK